MGLLETDVSGILAITRLRPHRRFSVLEALEPRCHVYALRKSMALAILPALLRRGGEVWTNPSIRLRANCLDLLRASDLHVGHMAIEDR